MLQISEWRPLLSYTLKAVFGRLREGGIETKWTNRFSIQRRGDIQVVILDDVEAREAGSSTALL